MALPGSDEQRKHHGRPRIDSENGFEPSGHALAQSFHQHDGKRRTKQHQEPNRERD